MTAQEKAKLTTQEEIKSLLDAIEDAIKTPLSKEDLEKLAKNYNALIDFIQYKNQNQALIKHHSYSESFYWTLRKDGLYYFDND